VNANICNFRFFGGVSLHKIVVVEKGLKHPVVELIGQGEGQRLDFKFAVNDSLKIARSLVAFANTDGGTLLIGVKDNGVIAGVRTAEEYYMVEAAASVYSSPGIEFTSKEWNIAGRKVLEITVKKGLHPPYFVVESGSGKHLYLRINDSNVETDRLMTRFIKLRHVQKGGFLSVGESEKAIFDALNQQSPLSFPELSNRIAVRRRVAAQIVVNMLLMKLLEWRWDGHQFVYQIAAQEYTSPG
jgi:hypothetical protein